MIWMKSDREGSSETFYLLISIFLTFILRVLLKDKILCRDQYLLNLSQQTFVQRASLTLNSLYFALQIC